MVTMNSQDLHNVKEEILIVDDSPDNLRLLSTILTRAGYMVRKSLHGQMALTSVQADPPDLILLDIKMPEMSGFDICRCLKVDKQSHDIPVIFISALNNLLDKVTAFEVGGVDYITKPFQAAEVLVRVETQLYLRRLQTQLVEQNVQLKQLNQELVRSNEELEQFASVVSHDLQQPLQSITSFAKILTLKFQEGLDADAQKYLDSIAKAGNRMQRLIHDLLAYAQAEQQDQEIESVDTNCLLDKVLANLQIAISEKNAIVTYDTLPTVLGSEVQLMQLFQNLLSNAIKFVPASVQPHITISATQQETAWQFSIHDNGIGIESQHLQRIFEVFQRLHGPQKYSGNGIGLATCQRIVENHGGRIWAQSQPEMGTIFYFTLPL